MKENSITDPNILMSQILKETRHYNEALKSDKVFHEIKDIRLKIREMATDLQALLFMKASDNGNQRA